jgi:hypothetical protein
MAGQEEAIRIIRVAFKEYPDQERAVVFLSWPGEGRSPHFLPWNCQIMDEMSQ